MVEYTHRKAAGRLSAVDDLVWGGHDAVGRGESHLVTVLVPFAILLAAFPPIWSWRGERRRGHEADSENRCGELHFDIGC